MNFLDSLAVGLRALSVNKMRSMLTVLGIIIGVAAVVCMVSVGSGAREEVSEKIRTLGANLLLIRPGAQLSGAARLETGTRQTLTEDDALALRRELTNVQAVAPLLSRPMQVVAGNNNWATLVAGIDNDYLVAREWRIANGRTFTLDELGSGAKVAIIGSDVGEALFPGAPAVGETLSDRQCAFHRNRYAGAERPGCSWPQSGRHRLYSAIDRQEPGAWSGPRHQPRSHGFHFDQGIRPICDSAGKEPKSHRCCEHDTICGRMQPKTSALKIPQTCSLREKRL